MGISCLNINAYSEIVFMSFCYTFIETGAVDINDVSIGLRLMISINLSFDPGM
jgi:hypothetical protein